MPNPVPPRSDVPRNSLDISDFPGLVSLTDPDDLPPGASLEQVNVSSERPGQLRVRSGLRVLSFDPE